MESTSNTYHRSNTKSASNLSLDLVLSSPKSNDTPNPSPVSSPAPLRDITLLSPSPLRKSRIRLSDRLEMASEDAADPASPAAPVVRKRGKGKGGQKGLLASPRNPRRSRRRSEAVEEKETNLVAIEEEIVKPRKRKTNVRPKKDKQSLLNPPCSSSSDLQNACHSDLNRIGEIISDLVMWRDVAKSTLWFGFGCLSFLSSCFAKGVNFSVFSVVSNLGLVLLCGSFLSNTLCQRKNEDTKKVFHVSEEDVLRLARRVLPAANFCISKTSELFSGEDTQSDTISATWSRVRSSHYTVEAICIWFLSQLHHPKAVFMLHPSD